MKRSGQDAVTLLGHAQSYQHVFASLAQEYPLHDLSDPSLRAELLLPVMSAIPLRVIVAAAGSDSRRDLGSVHGPGVILFDFRKAKANLKRNRVDVEQHDHKQMVKLVLHSAHRLIEEVQWSPKCGLMTWTEKATNKICADDENKDLEVLMEFGNQIGNSSSMLASMRWNYHLKQALNDNPQPGTYKWPLSFDNRELLLKVHELARNNLDISPVDDA